MTPAARCSMTGGGAGAAGHSESGTAGTCFTNIGCIDRPHTALAAARATQHQGTTTTVTVTATIAAGAAHRRSPAAGGWQLSCHHAWARSSHHEARTYVVLCVTQGHWCDSTRAALDMHCSQWHKTTTQGAPHLGGVAEHQHLSGRPAPMAAHTSVPAAAGSVFLHPSAC